MTRSALMSAMASIAVVVACAGAHAQVPGAMTWQVSLDEGQSWRDGDVNVSPSQSSVRVRLLASWDASLGGASPPTYFLSTSLDVVVAGAGSGDTISDVRGRRTTGYESFASVVAVQRFGSLLKVDNRNDTDLPGQGSLWITSSQGTDFIGVFSYGNPIEMLSYTLMLDGSIGTRSASGVWARPPSSGGQPSAFLSTGQTVVPTFHDARIIVPSPGAAGLGVVACFGLIAARRRRRAS